MTNPMDRRTFLRRTGEALAGAALAPVLIGADDRVALPGGPDTVPQAAAPATVEAATVKGRRAFMYVGGDFALEPSQTVFELMDAWA